ncbi:MAG TPA: SPOR domain-containing protein [Flavobacterium sp.]|nr:SPOR domain-containing protein [Flavobacterium sp.]
MKIEQSISQLLYRHQCVTVPGFGAFLTEIQSAHLHEKTNSFYPPMKLISFNPHLKNNDGLLANHISNSENTTYENAVSLIESEVVIWKSILDVTEKFMLKNIGELSLNSEKNIVFTPFANVNYLTESFGLNSFVSPTIKREILTNELKEEEKTESKIDSEDTTQVIEITKGKNRSYLKYAAILLLALSATGSIGYKLYDNHITNQTQIVETAVQKEVQNKIQEATFVISNPIPSVTLTVKEEKLSYHLVAGAFRNEKNAQSIYDELTRFGYHARRLAKNKHGLYPVLYGSYVTRAEANKALQEIKKSENPDAWLMVKEL